MRVGIFHNRYRERGGEDAVVIAEGELLEKAGHEVETMILDNREEIVSVVDALRTARHARRNPATIPRVHHFLDQHSIDVAHVHNFFPLFTPSLHTTLKVRGVPVVQSLHNYRLLCANGMLLRDDRPCEDCVTHGPWNAVRHGCYRGSRLQTAVWSDFTAHHRRRGTWHDAVDLFITPSHFAARKLAADIPRERMRVVPNPVPDPGEPGRLGHGAVFVGRLSPEKGVDRLLEAWRSMGDVPLTVVGDGPERVRLAASAAALPNVRLLGEQDHEGVLRALSAAAFLVQPSRCYEVAPLSVVEAMASGRAVVAPEHGAVADLMEPGRTGLLYRDEDLSSLSAACQTLHEDRELTRSFGIEARALYRAEFAPEPATAALVAVLESVSSPARG